MVEQQPLIVTPGDAAPRSSKNPSREKERSQIQQNGSYLDKGRMIHSGKHGRTRRVVVRRAKRKEKTPVQILCTWLVEHQIGLSINLLLLLVISHVLLPRARPFTTKFFRMQYYHPKSGAYTEGVDDAYFVFFWIVLFTGLRAATMDYVLTPIAMLGGIASKKGRIRFAEQGWLLLYDSSFWTLGMYILYHTPYFLNLRAMWADFPVRALSPSIKWYYLVQFAFWLQQLFVVNIEERRKDHWQMFTHHVFTSALLLWSYGFYQTKVGNVILCLMDVVDILLPLAKLLNYLNWRRACDIAFGIFMVAWLVARHILYLLVCWSVWSHVLSSMTYGCYKFTSSDPTVPGKLVPGHHDSAIWRNIFHAFTKSDREICFSPHIHYAFLGLLLALQVLTLIWFAMIVRVAYGVIMGKGAEDSRSDDEAESEIEEEEFEVEIPAYELMAEPVKHSSLTLEGNTWFQQVEVGAEGLRHVQKRNTPVTRSKARRAGGRASGISIPGHGDHKELLGRIGCDKPT